VREHDAVTGQQHPPPQRQQYGAVIEHQALPLRLGQAAVVAHHDGCSVALIRVIEVLYDNEQNTPSFQLPIRR